MDLNEAYRQILAALLDPEFQGRLIETLKKERRLKHAEQSRHSEIDGAFGDLDSFGVLQQDAEIIDRERALYSMFEEWAVRRMPQPAVISADDLQDIAFAQIGGMSEADEAYRLRRFLYHTLLKVSPYHQGRPEIDLGDWTRAGLESEEDYEDGPLWGDAPEAGPIELPNGFVLDIDIEDDPYHCQVRAKGLLRGVCTTAAAQRLTNQIRPAVESLMRSLKIAMTHSEMETARNSARGILSESDPNDIDVA